MKKTLVFVEAHEPDTVFSTDGFTAQDIAARHLYIIDSRQKSENKQAVEAMKKRSTQGVASGVKKPVKRKPVPATA